MTGWQITATTIYCDAVNDDVTIMVDKDWSTSCTGYRKYGEGIDRKTAQELKKKAKRLGRKLECEGPQDYRIIVYRDRLLAEDKDSRLTKPTKKKRA